MFEWRKRKNTSVDEQERNRPPEDLRCSFCEKAQADVRKLIAGPAVFICDECVDVCADIIANDPRLERQPVSGEQPPPRSPGPAPKNAVQCSLCGNAVAHNEVLPIESRGVLCGECADAVEDALSKGRLVS
jgi:hypothetical protein